MFAASGETVTRVICVEKDMGGERVARSAVLLVLTAAVGYTAGYVHGDSSKPRIYVRQGPRLMIPDPACFDPPLTFPKTPVLKQEKGPDATFLKVATEEYRLKVKELERLERQVLELRGSGAGPKAVEQAESRLDEETQATRILVKTLERTLHVTIPNVDPDHR